MVVSSRTDPDDDVVDVDDVDDVTSSSALDVVEKKRRRECRGRCSQGCPQFPKTTLQNRRSDDEEEEVSSRSYRQLQVKQLRSDDEDARLIYPQSRKHGHS